MANEAFKKFGDWDITLNLARNMAADIRRSNRIVLAQLASRAEAMAVKFVQQQNLPWKKLSDKYLARKARQGLSTKIYIATSTLFQSITSKAWDDHSFAGIFRKQKEKNGEYVADIAKVLEYGSIKRGIPPRRLWKVVYRDMRQFLIKEKMFASSAIRQMKKRTGGKG